MELHSEVIDLFQKIVKKINEYHYDLQKEAGMVEKNKLSPEIYPGFYSRYNSFYAGLMPLAEMSSQLAINYLKENLGKDNNDSFKNNMLNILNQI